ncbi:MAG: glycosyltransferase [Synergistaceae bacterium]|jgi:glycosyltransferase involved in cell wall biosynthesis|nr:glycosyltransferase [Synergistaceae bacterium]
MLPLISVIVPAYNVEGKIKSTLESIIAQDYENIEIVLVDDASTDSTLALSKETLKSGGRPWHVAEHPANRGVCAARNTGLRIAGGEYVLFFDADDLADENFVTILHGAITGERGSDLAFCGFRSRDDNTGSETTHPIELDPTRRYSSEDLTVLRIFSKIVPTICTFLLRRDFLLSRGLVFSEGCTAGEDVEMVIKILSECGSAHFSPKCPYIYVKHAGMGSIAGSATHEQRRRRYIDNAAAHLRVANFLIERSGSPKVVDIAKNYLLPMAQIKRLTSHAMVCDRKSFDDFLRAPEVREALRSSYKYFFKAPVIYLKALCLLCAPGVYYRMRAGYGDIDR